jgi:large subunit ribosomal protein L21
MLGGLVGVIWAMRDRFISISAPREPVAIPPLPGALKTQAPIARRAVTDDLTVIVGVGPVIASRLNQAGITSFADMTAAGPKLVAEAAKVGEEKAVGWIEQAVLLRG